MSNAFDAFMDRLPKYEPKIKESDYLAQEIRLLALRASKRDDFDVVSIEWLREARNMLNEVLFSYDQ